MSGGEDESQPKAPSAWKRFWLGQDKDGNVVAGEPIEDPSADAARFDPMRAPVDIMAEKPEAITTGTVVPNMNWPMAITSALKHSFVWKGRASRPAYWWVFLTYVIVVYGPMLLLGSLDFGGAGLLLLFVWVAFVPAMISVTVRRLHDSGRSGFWWWISIIPFIGFFIILALMLVDGDKEANHYGLPPQNGISSPE